MEPPGVDRDENIPPPPPIGPPPGLQEAPPPPPPPSGPPSVALSPHKPTKNRFLIFVQSRRPQKQRKSKQKSVRRKMPAHHLRKLAQEHKNMATKRANQDKISYLGALKYLPFALYKWLENMPNPWESQKTVPVLYHMTGALCIVDQTPKVVPPLYMAQWGSMWTAMQDEKRDRKRFKRLNIPPFDDEEDFVGYDELDAESEAIPCEFSDSQGGKEWHFNAKEMQKMELAARPLLRRKDNYLFNQDAFVTSKALHAPLPQGPIFEPLFEAGNDDIGEFTSLDKVIYRGPLKNETRVAYPWLYNNLPNQALNAVRAQSVGALLQFGKINIIPRRKDYRDNPDDGPAFLDDVQPPRAGLAIARNLPPFNKLSGNVRRAQDVNLIDWYGRRPDRALKPKVRNSHQKLLKLAVKRGLERSKASHEMRQKRLLTKNLAKTKFFAQTNLDWLETGLMLCKQGYTILQLLIHKRGLTFLHLDHNFNLKPTKTLTTKERKRSRFGHSFHLIRELLKLVKLLVDVHCQMRLGNCDAFELADAIQYIFNHVGQLTGIYRYKYKVMHQIKQCKDLKHLVYAEFNKSIGKGPGCGFWQPMWRVWLSFIRGMLPLLELWLGNLLVRQFEGREKKPLHTITKQRLDSTYDIELRAAMLHEILDMMPPQLRQSKTKVVMAHLSEAWRCWKANLPWKVSGMPLPVEQVINRYIKAKADNYINKTHMNRARLANGTTVDKSVAKKNVGRLTRMWLREEQNRQFAYLESGPWIEPEEAVTMYTTMAKWLDERNFNVVPFPAIGYKNDNKVLVLALESLREHYNMKARLNQAQREELALIEQAYDNPHETITRIKKMILTERLFKDVDVSLMDYYSHSIPVYDINALEKITDAYLDQYLWYEADKRQLFPNWIKPSDELAPVLAFKWCEGVNNLDGVWESEMGQSTVHVQMTLEKLAEKMDLTLLNRLLKLVVDPSIADYMTSRMNVELRFKDMSHLNAHGLIRGVQFSSFVFQFYGLMTDLLILGIPRALDIAGPIHAPNRFMQFENSRVQQNHPIRAYCRYFDKVFIVFRFENGEADELVDDYLDQHPHNDRASNFNNARCWPRDERMKMMRHDVNLACAVFWEVETRVPVGVATIEWSNSFVSVYSLDNPALLFNFLGFEIRLLPKCREEFASTQDSVWNLIDAVTQERTARAFLKVSQYEIDRFNNRVRQILMSSGATTFTKIVNKWNTALLGFFTYFREAAISTPELLEVLVRNEKRIQTKIKMGLNSKMPSRFPPCVFYSPKELGGLGMLSASHILIPSSDLRWSKETADGNVNFFRAGISHEEGNIIPTVFRYVPSWESEILDSQQVWEDYAQKRSEALQSNRRINLEDLEDSWDRGLPRINTLFQKNRATLAYDKGYRARQEFKQYSIPRFNSFWWTNSKHDGQLWNLNTYRTDMIEALGGIDTILEHSLFKATGFSSWEGLFWEQTSGFEDSMRFKKLTNAQRSGLSQIPNRRFTLWWSPTINRANVYVGFLVQLDLTGIFLHGKIPTLKISLVQIFRAHLWQKIHESLIIDMCQVLDREMDALQINEVIKLQIHPRKSYRMTSSSADILLTSGYQWNASRPSLLHDANDKMDFATTDKFWIDIQLRYGDYDSHDVTRYARAKFLDYTSDGISNYPSSTGVMVVVDLAYNTFDAYGNWIPGLKRLIQLAMQKIVKANPALHVLRERIRKALQLYQAQSSEAHLTSSNYVDMFGKTAQWFVDDTMVYRTVNHKTINGNFTTKPVNGIVFILNPSTGQLYLKTVHASTWAGQKKLNALAKWKTAEEVGNLLKTLPSTDLPKQLVVTSKGFVDPLQVHMLDFPNIAIRPSELNLPFRGILQHPEIASLVANCTHNIMAVYNIFDDWLSSVSATTAFSRLILVLRGLYIFPEKTKLLLRPDKSVKIQEHNLWPSLTADQWISLETELSDLILNDYGRKNNINIQNLTQPEIRDIILGQPLTLPENRKQQQQLEGTPAASEAAPQTVTTHNVHGEELEVVTTSHYEQQEFLSRSSWRRRAIETSTLHSRLQHLLVEAPNLQEETLTYVFPRNLVRNFVLASDTRSQVAAYLFGRSPKDNKWVKEVRSIVFVPQLGSTTTYDLPTVQPEVPGMELLGLIHTSTEKPNVMSAFDVAKVTELGWDSSKVIVSACFTPGSISLVGFHATGETSRGAQMILSDRFKGGCRVPKDELWNYAFMGAIWSPKIPYSLKLGQPLPFYDSRHRPSHFQLFSGLAPEGREDVF